jgi:hypothetical protein
MEAKRVFLGIDRKKRIFIVSFLGYIQLHPGKSIEGQVGKQSLGSNYLMG